MNLQFSLIDPTPALWNELDAAADSNCFFTAAWDNYLTRMRCHRIIVQVDRKKKCIGWFIGSQTKIGLRIISAPAMGTGTYAQGLCMKEPTPQAERVEIYKQLTQWLLKKRHADYIQICDWQMRTDSKDWIDDWHNDLLDNAGIRYNPRNTFYLDLDKTEEELWANLHYKSCKYAINKARKEGLIVRRVEHESEIDAFVDQHYDHILDVLHRKHSRGLPCQRRKNISAVCHSLFPDGVLMLQVIGKDDCGNEISMSSGIYAIGRNGSTYFTAGSYQRYMSHCPNELMVWEAMRQLHSRGARDLIFGGIAHYKKKFDPTYAFVPVMIFSRYRILLDLRRRGKLLYARLMQLLGR
ncbi:MAG: peptidoglycan bridge formation glycyltransferase FemA/FemB family protein [Bacteroidales bacterium]|nr:peptidoglycan bridge formation glycyltransferase FemA/FemB family protein [Bacteroidales bacterium]